MVKILGRAKIQSFALVALLLLFSPFVTSLAYSQQSNASSDETEQVTDTNDADTSETPKTEQELSSASSYVREITDFVRQSERGICGL